MMQKKSLLNNHINVESNHSFNDTCISLQSSPKSEDKNCLTALSCALPEKYERTEPAEDLIECFLFGGIAQCSNVIVRNQLEISSTREKSKHNIVQWNRISHKNEDSNIERNGNTDCSTQRSSSSSTSTSTSTSTSISEITHSKTSRNDNTGILMQEAIMALQNKEPKSKAEEELLKNAMNHILHTNSVNHETNLDNCLNDKKLSLAGTEKKQKFKLPNRNNRLLKNINEPDLDTSIRNVGCNDAQIDMDTYSAGANLLATIKRGSCNDAQIDMDAIRKTTAATKISCDRITYITTGADEKESYSPMINNNNNKEQSNYIKSRKISLTRPNNKGVTMNNTDARFQKGKRNSQNKEQKQKDRLSATDNNNNKILLLEESRNKNELDDGFSSFSVLYTKRCKTSVIKARNQVQIDFEMAMKEIQRPERN